MEEKKIEQRINTTTCISTALLTPYSKQSNTMTMRIESTRWCRSCDRSASLLVIICQTVCVVISWSSQSILNTNGRGNANNWSLCNDQMTDGNGGVQDYMPISDDAVAVVACHVRESLWALHPNC
eukprot:scaffold51870_cov42-Attheya_sp.AAC.1